MYKEHNATYDREVTKQKQGQKLMWIYESCSDIISRNTIQVNQPIFLQLNIYGPSLDERRESEMASIMSWTLKVHHKWIQNPMAVFQRLLSSMMIHSVAALGVDGGQTRY